MPKNYQRGKTKYIIVTGSVMSGVGKGTLTSCLGTLLRCHGLKISMIKFDGYLNYDAGTLNPFRHGEVFVLDDGTECDLDLGSYERFTNQNYTKDNYLTAGKIFKRIIDKERRGEFLGRDVQFIPHVTGEIKGFLRELAVKTQADVILVEVGGTVGDIENSYFIEAMRELKYEEGEHNVCFINVTYIIEPKSLQEQKSKAAQLGIRKLLELGVQPDIIFCRSENKPNESVREKISIYSNVPLKNVFDLRDLESVYELPLILRENNVDRAIFEVLKISERKNEESDINFSIWSSFIDKIKKSNKKIKVAIVGKYTKVQDAYISIIKALEHGATYYLAKPEIKWIEASLLEDENNNVKEDLVKESLKDVHGIIVPGGFGKRGIEAKISCIKYARENNIPFLGLCLGFQLAIIEFARNVCNLKDANSTEFDFNTKHPVIDLLPEQKSVEEIGGTMRLGGKDIEIVPNTLANKLYGKLLVRERFRHRFECNPNYVEILERHGMVFSGKAPNSNIMQILELPSHRFFLATQFHAEFTSKPLAPNPIFKGFVKSCLDFADFS
ncbi:MAG: CTP synthase [Candidatus Aenigmatarchaeota archaeon]